VAGHFPQQWSASSAVFVFRASRIVSNIWSAKSEKVCSTGASEGLATARGQGSMAPPKTGLENSIGNTI
jgi:hypothetical protein